MESAKVKIYVLIDPRDHVIRYVGKTQRSLIVRLQHHCCISQTSNCRRANWIAKLLRLGYSPRIQLVQEVNANNWQEAERYWIRYYRSVGCDLVNATDGGDGTQSLSNESKAKISAANLRRYGYPWERLKTDYEQLGSCKAVAELYECNEEVVRRHLAEQGISTFQKRNPEWPNLELDYRRLGSVRRVAELYGVSQKRITTQMNKRGIPRYQPAWTTEHRAAYETTIANRPEGFRYRQRTLAD